MLLTNHLDLNIFSFKKYCDNNSCGSVHGVMLLYVS